VKSFHSEEKLSPPKTAEPEAPAPPTGEDGFFSPLRSKEEQEWDRDSNVEDEKARLLSILGSRLMWKRGVQD